ncbi:MAG: DUF4256 domain-containing protein [Anaerolineales bacterium]|nr:DUF4256 domain-containing protein [Anaerolineales bacterium]MCX7609190.1 DUF4256 domain-containing protein [Anaerolineales bacterium]MDW8227785.1 DUF4256 domain-containing protein [Anaerolineales bacterium]
MKLEPLSLQQAEQLLATLEARFLAHPYRHPGLDWKAIRQRLESQPEKLRSLYEMEHTGGEPDIIGYDEQRDEYIFCDCSPESPPGRRSLCYDHLAWEKRKENKPRGNALDMAAAMGIEILSEQEYYALQQLGEFDCKTSSWIKTPTEIRSLGGALFGDRRYQRVFIYHNSAESYYASRGFRGILRIPNV